MAVSTRQALLQALSAAGGSYVSGQQLAETLGVSRAAVHKAAAALTAQGYALEAAPRRGYRLAGGDPFCAEAIGDYPAPIYLYDTLESSNRTAKLLALDGAPHGTLVLTAHQSGDLHRWLSQHYYEQEASQIETIRIEDRDCLAELCRILSVAYETGYLSHEDLAERRERPAPAVSWTSVERWQPIFPEKDPLILQRKMRFLYFT